MDFVGIIIDYIIAPIWHQLGHLIHYGRNIDDLRAQVGSLKHVRDAVERLVTAAERNGDVVRPYVNDWIEEANKIIQESEDLLDPEVNGNQNLVSRYKVSTEANNKKMVVDELISRGNMWIASSVSDPAPPPPIKDIYPADAEDFESRKLIINGVLDAIKDDKYNVIGVHGMGGIGKTTLITEVAKIAEKDKLIEVITPVVAVSQTPSIMKIQNEIAARLGMKLDEKENEPTRAGRLRDRIMKETRSILVILDDLWAEVKLEDIGIPRPSVHHKGYKFLLTTRNRHVCTQMRSQIDFPIEVLTEGEAWKLFQEKAGDGTFDSPNIRDIAIKVAKECAGLPLAIVVVAGALMKIKEQSVWDATLHRLQNPSPNSIKEMSPKLHESLKLSYDFLHSEEDKSCLLLCCLAPEDSNISVSELARWGMGLRLFSNVWKWVDVINRVRASIYKLKTHSLLLDSTSKRGEYVRMHDMVRDFAISIASESKRGIWARIDFGRSEWSDNYLLPLNNNDSTTIAVLNNFHHLPAQIDCPKLNLLLLQDFDNTHSTVIPEMFFKGMTELRVLSMVYMITCRCKRLSMVDMKTLPCISELKGLEILRLSPYGIIELPREIGELTRLRILDLSFCSNLERIPDGVLSRFSQLEGLYMDTCFDIKWGEDDSASLDELKGLCNLSDLHMDLNNHNAEHFPQDIQLPMRLSEFQFHLGRKYYVESDVEYLPKTLVVNGCDDKRIASHQGFKMLLNVAESLFIIEMEDVECFLSDVKREGFSTLKRLDVRWDRAVEYLANYTTKEGVMILPHKVFPVLETLHLSCMDNLKEICHGQLPAGSFCELTLLKVEWCEKLKKLINICSQNIANGFGHKLHEISIKYCYNLEEIFTYDDDTVGVEEETNEIIMLPKLRILKLEEVPNLATFCSKRSARTILQQQTIFFPEKIVFSNLNELVVTGSFEEIWPPQIPDNNFCRLTILEIVGCDKLKIAIPSNMVQRLRINLKRLVIKECLMMKEIVANTELGSEANPEGAHHGGSSVLEFPSLVELSIENCPKIETTVARNAEGNLDDTAQVLFNDKIVFSNLNKLVVSGSFEEIWPPQIPGNSFCRLTDLEIVHCDKLKIAIPSNMVQRLRNNFKRLVIRSCKMMKEIVANTELGSGANQEWAHHGSSSVLEFPALEELSIENCPKIETIVARIAEGNLDDTAQVLFNDKIIFPKLQTLEVNGNFEQIWSPRVVYHMEENFRILRVLKIDGCQKLKKAIPYNLAKSLHALEEMTIKNCALVEEVVEEVGESVHGEEILFPHLRKVKIDNCGGLRHFFSHSQAKLDFNQLQELEISSCEIMKEILLQESAEEDEEDKSSFLRFPQLGSLRLFGLQELTCFYHGNYTLEFPSLMNLTIEKCPKMEIVAFDDDVMVNSLLNGKIVFSNLNKLVVSGSFEEIWPPQIPDNSFCRLTDLKIDGCDKLKIAIPSNMVQRLRNNLKRLVITECEIMKEIVANTELGSGANQEGPHHGSSSVLEFPSLVELSIQKCPKIETIVARNAEGNQLDDTAQVLFNDKIIFPKLQTLKVSGNFEQIKSPRVVYHMEENFRMLRVLIIDGCQKLKKAIPYNLAKSLHALEEITVKNCDLVEEVVEEVEESVHGEEILFPHMRKVEIGNCGGLRHLFSHSQAKLYFMKETLLQESAEEDDEEDKSSFLLFPQLDSLRLFRLQELTCFNHGHYTLEFPSLKKLTIEECPKMETGAFDDDVMVNSLLNEKVLLPALHELDIIGLKCVKDIGYRQLPAKSFRQLSILKVSKCDSLRNLLTPSIVKHLSCLSALEIRECSSLEAVVVDANEEEQRLLLQVSDMQDKDVVFPRVVKLILYSLPNLRSFYSGGLTLEFPSLEYFILQDCPQMQTFSSGCVVTPKLDKRHWIQHLFQEKTKASLPALARLIHSNDVDDLTDACRVLSYLSNDNIQAVIEAGVCPRLVELLLHQSPIVLIPALRTVGNIVTGNDVQTQVIIGHQALPCLLNLLSSNLGKRWGGKIIRKEACRTISNITAGNRDQIQAVIEAGIIAPLVQLLQNDEFEIKEAAALAISNATSRSINEQIKFLVGQGCIKPLCDLLVCPDPKTVTVCLEGLENILKVGEVEKNLGNTGDVNLYAKLIDEAEGLEKIENLQRHENNEIYEKAVKILETYWLEEDELPPGDASQTGFHTGGNELPVPSASGGLNFS